MPEQFLSCVSHLQFPVAFSIVEVRHSITGHDSVLKDELKSEQYDHV